MPAPDELPAETFGHLIRSADAGNLAALDDLFTFLYRELHQLAERQLHRGGSGLTLGTTTLLHEAYLNLASREGVTFPDRSRFLAYAARAMRGLVVDHVRRGRATKRGGEFQITSIEAAEPTPVEAGGVDIERLAQALDDLSRADPGLAELVDLHFFSGFSLVEIARLRDVSERTVQRDWRKARLLLADAMHIHDGSA